MQIGEAYCMAVQPALDWLENYGVESDQATHRFLLAVGGQESAYCTRISSDSMERGWYRFSHSGVSVLFQSKRAAPLLKSVLEEWGLLHSCQTVFDALMTADQLAVVLARLRVSEAGINGLAGIGPAGLEQVWRKLWLRTAPAPHWATWVSAFDPEMGR